MDWYVTLSKFTTGSSPVASNLSVCIMSLEAQLPPYIISLLPYSSFLLALHGLVLQVIVDSRYQFPYTIVEDIGSGITIRFAIKHVLISYLYGKCVPIRIGSLHSMICYLLILWTRLYQSVLLSGLWLLFVCEHTPGAHYHWSTLNSSAFRICFATCFDLGLMMMVCLYLARYLQ